MGYTEKEITLDEAKTKTEQYPYALVNLMSEMYLGKSSDIGILWDELLEARFFSETEEMHIFKCEKDWKSVIVTDDGNLEDTIIKSYPIASRFRAEGSELFVKEYLASDDDGQMYVEQTRICGIGGKKSNGKEE